MISDVYTAKQIEVLKETLKEDWFMLILHGAKRSGKTKINNDIFLFELRRIRKIADKEGIKEPMYILAGVSSSTIQKNILQELYNMYNITPKFDKFGNFKLFGVKVIQTYTGSIAGVGAIRGMTAHGAYINEASLANREVFAEIVSRCSGSGARILADTNPDYPEHWLKKEYIDKPNENVKAFHFELDDNIFLSERYRENIKAATPSGMFYARDIKGLWVSGYGAVYSDFDKEIHVIDEDDVPWKEITKYYAGVDWGYKHWGSIVVIGETDDGRKYLVREYATQHQDIDYWVDIGKTVITEFGNEVPFYCDSARPEYVERFLNEGFFAYNADKSVVAGIALVAKGYKTNTLFIVRQRASRFFDEVYQYVWNDKTGEPVKAMDDVQDAVRYAIYTNASSKDWLY